jgi:hypothetical protein
LDVDFSPESEAEGRYGITNVYRDVVKWKAQFDDTPRIHRNAGRWPPNG